MTNLKRGDLVELNGLFAAVVGVEGDAGVPEGHVALFYGADSEGKADVWTVPSEYPTHAAMPTFRH